MMEQLGGVGVALITPFNKDLSIDVDALQDIVRYCIDGGVDYLVVLGTTGEAATLTKVEKQLVMDTVVAANLGRLPLILGVGGNNTTAVIAELQELDLSNYMALLSVSPYYNKPTQEGIYQHFKAIATVAPKPIIVYNVPGRTGSNVLSETLIRLANDFDNIVGVKEASGDIVQVMRIIKDSPKEFQVISGEDSIALPTVLAGGTGVISVLGQGLPVEFTRMIQFGLQGDVDNAYKIHYQLQEGIDLIFQEGNPAGIKTIFETLGISNATVRLPLMEATASLKEKIAAFVKPFAKAHA